MSAASAGPVSIVVSFVAGETSAVLMLAGLVGVPMVMPVSMTPVCLMDVPCSHCCSSGSLSKDFDITIFQIYLNLDDVKTELRT
jgi:hypothetical protein